VYIRVIPEWLPWLGLTIQTLHMVVTTILLKRLANAWF
jgi:hypothetical protein